MPPQFLLRFVLRRLQVGRVAILLLVLILLTGCIRPDVATPTPEAETTNVADITTTEGDTNQPPTDPAQPPAAFPSATPDQPSAPTSDSFQSTQTPSGDPAAQLAAAVQSYFLFSTGQQLPADPQTVSFWSTAQIGTEFLTGFVFNNPSGLPCVGIAAYREEFGNLNVYNGGYHCSTDPSQPGVAAQWLMDIGGIPIVAITGKVTAVGATGVGIEYQNIAPEPAQLSPNGNFLVPRQDFSFASTVTIPDQNGNLIGSLAVPMNPER